MSGGTLKQNSEMKKSSILMVINHLANQSVIEHSMG